MQLIFKIFCVEIDKNVKYLTNSNNDLIINRILLPNNIFLKLGISIARFDLCIR
jgi:hypothetical protein